MLVRFLLPSCFMLLPILLAPAHAGVIVSPDSVIDNSMGELSGTTDSGNIIDQSGLSQTFESGVTDFDTYLQSNPTHTNVVGNDTGWSSASNSPKGYIDFDLGAVYQVDRFVLWQQGTLGEQVQFGTLFMSSTPDFSSSEDITEVAGLFLTPGVPADNKLQATLFDLDNPVGGFTGRYFRLSIKGNKGAQISSIGEVAFGGILIGAAPASGSASAVPEPTTWAALAFCCVAAGLKRLRRPWPARFNRWLGRRRNGAASTGPKAVVTAPPVLPSECDFLASQ